MRTDRGAPRDQDEPAIVARGLAKTYAGGVDAVRGIDFDVERGEVFGLLGPNGAGKSTTIGMLTSTVVPTAGWATLGGFDVASQPLEARRISSVLFQEPVVDRPLTGRRNLELHARLWGVPVDVAASRIADISEVFGLGSLIDRPVGGYSGGERRRLEIARALVSEPAVLFLDEPTVGLDPRIRHELLDVIGGLRERAGMTILLTTHYLDEAERLCDRLAIMHEGRIAALDTPAALMAALGDEVVEVRVGGRPEPVLQALRARQVVGDEAFAVGSTVLLPVRGGRAAEVIGMLGELAIDTIAVGTRKPSLDDVYLRLTGARLADAA